MSELRWAVIGVGIAGRARARALFQSERDELVALWRGRFAAEVEAPVVASFDEALSAADAVAICSPTEHHAAQVRAALRADRHVVVEFPLARSRAEAEALFALARQRGRVLHVEHIELLGAAGRTLAAQTRPELVERIEVHFEKAGPDDAGAPALALGNVARLHRLCAIAGPMSQVDEVTVAPGELRAEVRMASGVVASLRFSQGPYFKRTTRVEVHTASSHWVQNNSQLSRDGHAVSLLGTRSLFAADQRIATARILDGDEPYVSDARVLHVLGAVERLATAQPGPIGA